MAQNYDFLRSFTINGKETKHLFQIAKLNIPFLSKENEFFQVGNTDGKHFRNTRLGDYTLSIDGFIIKDNTGKTVPQVMDELKSLVNSDEPQKLVFDIFPDRYFNAIFTGAEEYDATDLKYTPLTLTFDVPDGLAHAIEPIGFSNTYSDNKNLMLDSEYNAINKYMKPWVQKLDEKFDNSNVVWADFTNGIPLNFERDKNSDERWLNWNPMTTIHVPELKVGDEVNFSVYANVVSIDEENNKDYAGQVILEEWDTVKGAILKRHIAYIPKKVTTEFTEYGSVVKIENENTNAINLQYGFRGSNLIKWSKPMVSFLPPIGETVTAPSVGAKAYSNSLDFGDYDYSTAPNLLPTLDYSKLSRTNQNVQAPLPYIKDYGDYFVLDANDTSAVGTSRNCFVPFITRLTKGKTYTLSVSLMVDDEFGTDYGNSPMYYCVTTSTGTQRLVTLTPNQNAVNNWVRVSKTFTIPSNFSDGDFAPFLQLYQGTTGKGKLYVRYDIMIQEGDQTSSQVPANQLSKITTEKWYAISAVERTEEEGNITSFKYPAKTGINKISYLQNDKNLIPLLSDKKQYTLSAEVWLEKEVNAPVTYRVNDRNDTGKVIMVANTVNVPAKQWTKVSTTQTINLPSNPNMIRPESQQPVTSSGYLIKTYNTFTMTKGKKYTITLKGTKPDTQTFRPYFPQETGSPWGFGDMKLVAGTTDIYSGTFTASADSHPTSPQVQIYQVPSTTVGECTIEWIKLEEGETYTPDYPQHWVQLNAPEDYNGIIKIKNDSIKIQEGAKTTKPAWKPNLLGAPYYLSKVALGENILKPASFPINTTEYMSATFAPNEPYVQGQKYTFTMKASKPSTQTFGIYLRAGSLPAGNMVPVEGLTDVWQIIFTITQAHIDGNANALNVFQMPQSTKGTVNIEWAKLEKGDTRTPNIPYYKYEGIAPAPSNNPNDYHWGYSPSYINAVEYVPSGDSVGDLIKIENNGTYRTKPRFSFRMKGENGLVALLNQNGAILQFGNPEDVDGKTSSRVEPAMNETFWGNTLNPALKVNTGFKSVYPNMNSNPATPNKIQGTLNMKDDPDAVQPVYIGVGDINVWHGPTVVGDIAAPSNTDRTLPITTHFRFGFDNHDKGQRGRLEFSTFDEAGNPIMTAIIRDSTTASNELVFEAWYKNSKLHQMKLDRKVFNKTFYEMNMDRRGNRLVWRVVQIKSLNQAPGGWSQATIDKEYKFVWTLPEPDTSKFTKAGFWFMRFSNKYGVIMRMTDMQARWEGTPYYQDLKNYFQDGDLVEIDTATRELFVNGVVNNQLNVVGNQWEKFELETGETIIQPIVSEWANMAEVTAEITQNYL